MYGSDHVCTCVYGIDMCTYVHCVVVVVEGKRSSGKAAVWVSRDRFAVLDKTNQVNFCVYVCLYIGLYVCMYVYVYLCAIQRLLSILKLMMVIVSDRLFLSIDDHQGSEHIDIRYQHKADENYKPF